MKVPTYVKDLDKLTRFVKMSTTELSKAYHSAFAMLAHRYDSPTLRHLQAQLKCRLMYM